MQQLFVSIEDC
ncbi:hypothetical protein LINPERPRIM_LOCUS40679 [Linum perenne]